MRKIKIKTPAKVNFTLDVTGVKNGYHVIKSLVATVNVYDTITLIKRNDKRITLKEMGKKSGCSVVDNNAFKAVKAFKDEFLTGGVDIILEKNIPVGGGMGGSSADIAGVLNGMKALFKPDADVKPLADALGSDSGYMLSGGWAIISDRGNVVDKVDVNAKLYLIILYEEDIISARECYKTFDKIGEYSPECTDIAVDKLLKGDMDEFLRLCKNDLFNPAKELLPKVSENLSALILSGTQKAVMTGSGSAVFAIFKSAKERDKSYKKLLPLYGEKLIKANTL